MDEQSQQTLFAEGSLAKTSPSRENKLALKATVQDYGRNSVELLAKYDHATRLWRTSQTCLQENGELGLAVYSETWPRSGMMRNGIAYQLPMLAPAITETEFSLLLTPSANMYRAWTFQNPFALIRRNHADGNIQEQLMRLFQRMITPECAEIMMVGTPSWTDLKHSETP